MSEHDDVVAQCAVVGSPVGPMVVCWGEQGILWVRAHRPEVGLVEQAADCGRPVLAAPGAPEWVVGALAGGGEARVDLSAATSFQRQVLEEVSRVPAGETVTYAQLARRIGNGKAVRAVGTALATNPVPLLVPCHRVVRSDGASGSYIFGDAAKRQLLLAEGASLG